MPEQFLHGAPGNFAERFIHVHNSRSSTDGRLRFENHDAFAHLICGDPQVVIDGLQLLDFAQWMLGKDWLSHDVSDIQWVEYAGAGGSAIT